jgi:hypothetical protein
VAFVTGGSVNDGVLRSGKFPNDGNQARYSVSSWSSYPVLSIKEDGRVCIFVLKDLTYSVVAVSVRGRP